MFSLKFLVLSFIFKKRYLINRIYFELFFGLSCIKKDKIVFCNYQGSSYGCNPKYITEEIIAQNLPFDIVWLVKPDFNMPENFPKQVRLVNYYDKKASFKELATAKFWVDNTRKIYFVKKGLRKKRGQFYINTWHGSLGIKKLDADVALYNDDDYWKNMALKDAAMTDIMISNSDFETEIYRRGLWYKNKIEEFGHPRNDIFFKDRELIKNKVYSFFDIPKEVKIALYTPSFRDDLRIEPYQLDYAMIRKILEKKTGEKWLILSKFHPKILYKLKRLINSIDQKDVSIYPDIQELLVSADILISDYSSCMFDYMYTKRPCFVYATDIERYNTERGFYFSLESTPFLIARDNLELANNIENFDINEYNLKVESFLAERKIFDDGNASKRTVELIKQNM